MIGVLRTRSGWFACLLAGAVLAVSACGGDEPVEPEPDPTEPTEPTAPAPKVAVPRGVELTEQGAELAIGETASAIYQPDKARTSVVDVTVSRILRGSVAGDLAGFDLPDKVRRQTPYYVSVRVTNNGPGQLGGASVPVFALDSTATYFPATTLIGRLSVCPGGPLPQPFAPQDTQTRCLLFLAQPDETLDELQLRPYEGYDPVSWTVPARIERATSKPARARPPSKTRRPADRG